MNHPNDKRKWNLISESESIQQWETCPYINIYGNTVVTVVERRFIRDEWVIVSVSAKESNNGKQSWKVNTQEADS